MGKVDTGEIFSGIYKITNNINGKFYIGQSIDVNHRFYEHKINCGKKHNSAIDAAIQKYGVDNFSFEVLERCEESELFDKETYWSDVVFNCECYAPNGYNISRTGIGSPSLGTIISSYDLDGNIIHTYLNSSRASKELKISSVAIRSAVNRKGICAGTQWRYGNERKIEKYTPPVYGETICCYDRNGVLQFTFNNGVEASEYFNVSPSAISSFVLHKDGYVRCKGYYLAKNNELPIIRDNKEIKHKTVYCYEYDKTTRKLLHEYHSIKEATICKNAKDSKSIRNALNGVQNFANGSIWSVYKFDIIPENYRELNKKYKEDENR